MGHWHSSIALSTLALFTIILLYYCSKAINYNNYVHAFCFVWMQMCKHPSDQLYIQLINQTVH